MAPIEVTAVDHLLREGAVLYNFRVCFGRLAWVVSRSHDDFAGLHNLLKRHDAAARLPRLPGPIRPWARNTPATVTAKHSQLAAYVNEALATAPVWSPRVHDVAVEDRDGGAGPVLVNEFLCEFLEVLEHTPSTTVPPVAAVHAGETEREGATSAPASGGRTDVLCCETATTIATSSSSAPAFSSLPGNGETDRTASFSVPGELPALSSSLSRPWLSLSSSTTLDAQVPLFTRPNFCNDSAELALDTTVFTITSQMLVDVKDFSIIQKDHIRYFLHVSLCGHRWVVTKRYRQLHELHVNLVRVYGDHVVPVLPHGWTSAWRKLTVETGEARKQVFNRYLQEVVMNIDSWEPRGLLTSCDLLRSTVHGEKRRLTVYINQILFDFFDFSLHIDALSGEVAAKVVVEHRAALPESVKLAYDRQSIQKKRLQMREYITNNAQRLNPLRDDQLQALLDRLPLLQDDRDIMHMFRRLLLTGEVDADVESSFVDLLCDTSKEKKGGEDENSAASASAVVGVTTLQLARITERLFFNDTKRESIRLFAGVLLDVENLQAVFDTLWFGWEEAREEVEEILSDH